MNIALLTGAIKARIDADTGAGGLSGTPAIIQQSGYDRVPEDIDLDYTSKPYLVYTIGNAAQDDTFSDDAVSYLVRFAVYSDRKGGLSQPSAVLSRVKGDAMAQTTGVPTYGFHRWAPTITGYECTAFERTNGAHNHSDSTFIFIDEYTVRVSEPRATS